MDDKSISATFCSVLGHLYSLLGYVEKKKKNQNTAPSPLYSHICKVRDWAVYINLVRPELHLADCLAAAHARRSFFNQPWHLASATHR